MEKYVDLKQNLSQPRYILMRIKNIKNYVLSLSCLILLVGCSTSGSDSEGMSTLAATSIGAGVGAGAGAIVGSVISDGDVLASAGLGAGIGAGTVLISRYAYRKYQENKAIKDNNSIIRDNYDLLKNNQLELDEYRRHVAYDSKDLEPTDEVNRHFEGVID